MIELQSKSSSIRSKSSLHFQISQKRQLRNVTRNFWHKTSKLSHSITFRNPRIYRSPPLHLSAMEPRYESDVSPITTPKTSTFSWAWENPPTKMMVSKMRWTMGKWMAATKIGIKYLEYVLCTYLYSRYVGHFLRVPLISLSQNQMKQIRNILSNPSFLTKSRWLTDLGDLSMLQSGDSGVANSPGPSPKSWSNRSCFGKNDAKNDLKGNGKQTRNERNNKSTSVLNIFWSISNSHRLDWEVTK